jgi:hypothetical protein
MAFTQSQFEFLDNKAQSADTKADNALGLDLSDILNNGNIANTPIILQDGSASAPAISFSGNTGLFKSGSGQLAITTDGVEAVKVTRTTLALNAEGGGIVLRSPNGSFFNISVDNAGSLVITIVG